VVVVSVAVRKPSKKSIIAGTATPVSCLSLSLPLCSLISATGIARPRKAVWGSVGGRSGFGRGPRQY